jgi:site-specific DNA recombinase
MARKPIGNNAVIYARISRDIMGEGLGVERQIDHCRALAASRGLSVVQEFTDNDISAYSGRLRPAYREMLGALESGDVGTVICWHTDRLHRSPLELEEYISLSERHDVATLTVESGELDLSTPNGRMTARVHGAVSRQESEHKAKRIRSQKEQAAKAGKFLGGRVPWGWRIEGGVKVAVGGREVTKGGSIVVDEAAAEFIRTGTQAILDGHGLIEVTRRWDDAGARSLTGKRLNTTQVRRVLLRPRNAGLVMLHGELISGEWPPIVDVEVFRAVEAKLTDPSVPRQSAAKFKYLLSGLMRCYCGRYMTGFGAEPTPLKPTHRRMYRCTVHSEGGKYVRGHATREMKNLDTFVRDVVAEYLNRPDVKDAVLPEAGASTEGAPVKPQDTGELMARRAELARLFADGIIERSQLVEGTARIREQLADIERQAVRQGGNRELVGMLMTANPGDAFLGAETALQREVIRALVEVHVIEGVSNGGQFQPEFIRFNWLLSD